MDEAFFEVRRQELRGRFAKEILNLVDRDNQEELARVFDTLVLQEKISFDEFKQRVENYVAVLDEMKTELLPEATQEAEEGLFGNALISLDYFLFEMVVIKGKAANELSSKVLVEFEKVRNTNRVTINIERRALSRFVKEGRYKTYHELPDKRRDEINGRKVRHYTERRVDGEAKLGYDQPFVVAAMGSDNGYDEIIGPAPAYGHGVIELTKDKAKDVEYFEGDSMSAKDVVREVMPDWLLRKWDNFDSRKLDERGAQLVKSIMEVYLQEHNLTHIHNMYVEAHVLGGLSLEDVAKITYAIYKDESYIRKMNELKAKGGTDEETADFYLEAEEEKKREKIKLLGLIKDLLEKNTGGKLTLEIVDFSKEIKTREEKFTPGVLREKMVSDNRF